MVKKTLIAALLLASIFVISSIPAYADSVHPLGDPTDVSISSGTAFSNQLFSSDICNNGPDTVIGLHYGYTISNFTVAQTINLPRAAEPDAPTDFGTLDANGDWTGVLEANQCLTFSHTGIPTGDIGQTIQFDTSISNVILEDASTNVDPDESNNTESVTSPPITLPADLAVSARLLTSGEITSGSEVRYELTISNVGQGEYDFGAGILPTGIYALLPTGATLVGAIDEDPNDGITLVDDDVNDPVDEYDTHGVVVLPDVSALPAFSAYSGALYGVQIASSSTVLPAGGSFKMIYVMTANGSFASGDTNIAVALAGNDGESYLFQYYLAMGNDPFVSSIEDNLNNVALLTYDATPLTATVARCSGIGEVVTTNDACFTMTFNKVVSANDFTVDDLIVTGGNVYSFVQDSPTQWTIRINNMLPNTTLTLDLGLGTVVDLSAVTNNTYVLGINTVRYEVPESTSNSSGSASGTAGTTATGTLAETGSQTLIVFYCAVMLTLLGMGLVATSKKFNFLVVQRN